MQRLKRVFNIDIMQCEACEKLNVRVIVCNTKPAVIHKVLAYLDKKNIPDENSNSDNSINS